MGDVARSRFSRFTDAEVAALYAYLHDTVPALAVQASGGVSAVTDVEGARQAGCAGIVLGRALLEGRFALPEALAC